MTISRTVYPGILPSGTRVSVLAQDGVTPIPNSGAIVADSEYYQDLVARQVLLTYDPVDSGGIPIELLIPPLLVTGTPVPDQVLEATGPSSATWADPADAWFDARAATGDVTAARAQLVMVTPSAATTVVTAPAGASSAYFGVQLCGQSDGKVVEVRHPDTTLLATLDVDNESVWLVYDSTSASWRVNARYAPPPVYTARFSPLATWLSSGADADLSDTSGNGRTLTKAGTIRPAAGAEKVRLATAFPGRYTSADAAFALGAGAMSIEILCCVFLTQSTTGPIVQYGSGSGGSANNIQYSLSCGLDGNSAPCWVYACQNGANANVSLNGPVMPFGWQHVTLTRGATVKMYINGVLGVSGSPAAPDGGASGSLNWGGTATGQARAINQMGSIWGSELTATQVAYLAQLRLGKLARP